jgi:hypothetical protein
MLVLSNDFWPSQIPPVWELEWGMVAMSDMLWMASGVYHTISLLFRCLKL